MAQNNQFGHYQPTAPQQPQGQYAPYCYTPVQQWVQYPQQSYPTVPTQPAVPYQPYAQYPNGYPIYPNNPYYYDPEKARQEYEKRLKVEKAKQALRYLGNMSGLSIILFLVFNTLVSSVLAVPGWMELYQKNSVFNSAFSIIASFVYIFIPFSIIAFLIRRRDTKVNFFPFKKMQPRRALLCIPIGLSVCIGANVFTNMIINLFDSIGVKLSQQSDGMVEPQGAFALVMSVLCTALMPALLEEYALRGVILQPARRYGMLFAIISSSAIFGLMHGNLIQAPFAFLVGMCFAFMAIKCDSLWIGVILHFLNNGFSVVMSYLMKRLPEAKINLIYYIIIGIVVVAGIVCFAVLLVKDKEFFKKTEGNIAGEEATILSAGQKFVSYFVNAPMIISFVLIVLLTAQYIAKK